MGLAPFILILEFEPRNLAKEVDAAKRKVKAYKTTLKEKCKMKKMVGA